MLHYPSNIKKIRGLQGTTQEDFAASMNVSVNMQKSYETGRAKPDVLYFSRLAKLSSVSAEILATKEVDIADMYVKRILVQKDEKGLKEKSSSNVLDVYSSYDPLTRSEISEMISTNRMQAEAILNLSRKINSPKDAKASGPVPPGEKGKQHPYRDGRFSGRKKQSGGAQE